MAAGMSPSPKARRSLVSHTAPAQLIAAAARETVAMPNAICLVMWISPCPVSALCAIGVCPSYEQRSRHVRDAPNVGISRRTAAATRADGPRTVTKRNDGIKLKRLSKQIRTFRAVSAWPVNCSIGGQTRNGHLRRAFDHADPLLSFIRNPPLSRGCRGGESRPSSLLAIAVRPYASRRRHRPPYLTVGPGLRPSNTVYLAERMAVGHESVCTGRFGNRDAPGVDADGAPLGVARRGRHTRTSAPDPTIRRGCATTTARTPKPQCCGPRPSSTFGARAAELTFLRSRAGQAPRARFRGNHCH